MVDRVARSVGAVALGALLAVAVTIVVVSLGDGSPSDSRSGAAVRQLGRLQRDWERWRRLDVVYLETTTRTASTGDLTAEVRIAQRFPDRVTRDGGAVSAQVQGRAIGCSPDRPGSEVRCIDNGAVDNRAILRAELKDFADQVAGDRPRYRLSPIDPPPTAPAGSRCHRLRHLVEEFRPRWGDTYDVCFGESGLATWERTRTGDLTITVVRRRLGVPTDQDLALPAPPTR